MGRWEDGEDNKAMKKLNTEEVITSAFPTFLTFSPFPHPNTIPIRGGSSRNRLSAVQRISTSSAASALVL